MNSNTKTILLAIFVGASVFGGARAGDNSTAEQIVGVMNKLWGDHPGTRANHAKGVVLEGTFTPGPEGQKLSKAELFGAASIPVTLRFSDSTGLPNIPAVRDLKK